MVNYEIPDWFAILTLTLAGIGRFVMDVLAERWLKSRILSALVGSSMYAAVCLLCLAIFNRAR